MRHWIPLVLVLLAGCGERKTAEEVAAENAEAVAAVVAANDVKPAAEPLTPQAIGWPDVDAHDIRGAGCNFAPSDGGLGTLFVAMAETGYIKLDGKLIELAADSGSPQLPYQAHETYTGQAFSARLTVAGEGSPSGAEKVDYSGQLVVSDAHERVVYDKPGLVQCGG